MRWLHAHAADRGVDPRPIALGGDSAGGNMTCVVAQKLSDEGGPRLALQVPLYPETALPFETKSGVENRTGLYLETAARCFSLGTRSRKASTTRSPTSRRGP